VFVGPVLDALEAADADFVVESWGGRPADWTDASYGYFDLEALERLDPAFAFPGYTFNAGHVVATTGMLRLEDYMPLIDFDGTGRPRHDCFEPGDQGVLNYLLLKKAQAGELTLDRAPFMVWGQHRLPWRGPHAIRLGHLTDESPHRYLIHWSTAKSKFFLRMPNGRLLRHFERYYYSRVPHGQWRRGWRGVGLTWRVLTGREPERVRWNPGQTSRR